MEAGIGMIHYIQTEVPFQKTLYLMNYFHKCYGGDSNASNLVVNVNGNIFKFLPVDYPKSKLKGLKVIPYKDFEKKYYKPAK